MRLLGEQTFDLVLLDIMMPKMSGYEVCRLLRQKHPIGELPVIFLTAKNQTEDVVTGLSLGANDYLAKPISRGELTARVRPTSTWSMSTATSRTWSRRRCRRSRCCGDSECARAFLARLDGSGPAEAP